MWRIAAKIAWLPFLVVLLAFVSWIGLMATGHRTLVVLSGSMTPALNPGDVAIVKTITPDRAEGGDIVTFRDPSRARQLVTHRAVFVRPLGNVFAFVTKGDQNTGVEEWTVDREGKIGLVTGRVPVLGHALVWLDRPDVRAATVGAAFLLLGGVAVRLMLQLGGRTVQRPVLLIVAAGLGLVVGGRALPTTLAAFSSVTVNSGNTFEAAGSFCSPGTETVFASADAWIDEASPVDNAGNGPELMVRSAPASNRRALVTFDLPSPGACAVTGASLELFTVSESSIARTLDAHQVSEAWTEGDVTWNNQPATTGAAASTTSGPGWISWDVSAMVASMYAGTDHGFRISDAIEDVGLDEQIFASREAAEAPRLVVTLG